MDTCYQSKGTPDKLLPMNINFFTISLCYWRSQNHPERNKKYPLLFIYYLWQPLIWHLYTLRSEEWAAFWHFQTNTCRRGHFLWTLWHKLWWSDGLTHAKNLSMLIGFLSNMLGIRRQLQVNICLLHITRDNIIRGPGDVVVWRNLLAAGYVRLAAEEIRMKWYIWAGFLSQVFQDLFLSDKTIYFTFWRW